MTDAPLGWKELFDPTHSEFDSLLPFLGIAQALAGQAHTVVEVGCGRGAAVDLTQERRLQDLRGAGRKVIGIDVDPAAHENPVVDEVRLIEADGRWPLADGEADLAVSDWVLEHVDDPALFVSELTRVLRPGGVLVARSVSRRSPLSIAARTVPNRRHATVLSRLQPTREERDVFPTRYRMNTRRDLARLLGRDFEWRTVHRADLHQYLLPWPWASKALAAGEPRAPRSWRSTFVLYARRRTG